MFSSFALASLLLLASQDSAATRPADTLDLDRYFEGHDACMVILDTQTGATRRYRPERCAERLAPCSTFKFPHAIIALETGAVADPDASLEWDGVNRWNENWNRDHTLRTAVRDSTVWYFQRVVAEIGRERMQEWLKKLNYGNADCSGELTKFWLDRPLLISADEQVEFLARFCRGALPISQRTRETAGELIRQGDLAGGTLFGKTGTHATDGTPDLGWFVGYLVLPDRTLVFAANAKPHAARGMRHRSQSANGPYVRTLVRSVLEDLAEPRRDGSSHPGG